LCLSFAPGLADATWSGVAPRLSAFAIHQIVNPLYLKTARARK
jgi:hypothetical protein